MVVTTRSNGSETMGLRVGAANARRYFPRNMGAVELTMGDLQIQCRLLPEFWKGRPEIHDPRLGEWLKFKTSHARSTRQPITLAMVQSGTNSFTLHSLSPDRRRSNRAEHSMASSG